MIPGTSHGRRTKQRPASISASGPHANETALALAVAAAVVLIELLDRKRLGAGRSNGASKERQGDKRGYDGLHGHSPSLASRSARLPSVFASGDMTVTGPPRSVAGHKAIEKARAPDPKAERPRSSPARCGRAGPDAMTTEETTANSRVIHSGAGRAVYHHSPRPPGQRARRVAGATRNLTSERRSRRRLLCRQGFVEYREHRGVASPIVYVGEGPREPAAWKDAAGHLVTDARRFFSVAD
jgi:hypothetical protein